MTFTGVLLHLRGLEPYSQYLNKNFFSKVRVLPFIQNGEPSGSIDRTTDMIFKAVFAFV